MTESEVELQVVIPRTRLIAVLGVKCRRIGEEQVGIDTSVRTLTLVTGVVCDTSTQIRMPSAFHLIRAYQSPFLVFVVQQLCFRIQRFLVRQLRVKLVLTVQHVDIAIVDDIAQHTKTGIPLQILVYRSFDISRYTNQVAFILVEHTRDIVFHHHLFRFLRPIVPSIVILRLIAVKAVKVAHRVRQIRRIQCQTITRNEILRVVVKTEDSVVFRRVRRL